VQKGKDWIVFYLVSITRQYEQNETSAARWILSKKLHQRGARAAVCLRGGLNGGAVAGLRGLTEGVRLAKVGDLTTTGYAACDETRRKGERGAESDG
jgi:hypothetical protein